MAKKFPKLKKYTKSAKFYDVLFTPWGTCDYTDLHNKVWQAYAAAVAAAYAKEFLALMPHTWFSPAEWHLTVACVAYLLFDAFMHGMCRTDSAFEARI
ncbi:hypothetical protein MMYC01_208475 [Madurella mycetomatis]|uniref:Uncharacterized protein n=1 Tax=Madurella mycetomatis TaxID=100816 RepID=A0A175VXQ2_9PEZI|nr:hypothetical protein MMYC01_208475 [Madurella mycetomatis]